MRPKAFVRGHLGRAAANENADRHPSELGKYYIKG